MDVDSMNLHNSCPVLNEFDLLVMLMGLLDFVVFMRFHERFNLMF